MRLWERRPGGARRAPFSRPDRFRITIWNKATGTVVYDNKLGSLEDSSDAAALDGSGIVIHR